MAKAEIKHYTDDYGFECLDIRTSEGGSKHVTYFGPGTVDIGHTTSMNPGGLGGSDYIRNADDVKRHIADVKRTKWLNEDEQKALVVRLLHIEKQALGFLKVKERFDVVCTYVEGGKLYCFTEKGPAITMHTRIAVSVITPSGWNESSAWQALYKVLDPKATRPFEKTSEVHSEGVGV